ncbi:hypothetical protein [Microseira wollei]|uniref:hypothetical protein n=1 Tax=Microseira wollei TaxID=467598 RepID=UPI001CFF2199|nr:hypothetical protein [Microseira wollei]
MATTISANKSQESKQFKSQKKSKVPSGINTFEVQPCQNRNTSSRELLSDWKDAS